MKYKFHVGDYVELKDGRYGYIAEIQCSTFSVHLIGLNPELVSMMYPLLDNFHFYSNNFIRIGQYDFTKKDEGKIEPLICRQSTGYCHSKLMWDKINELVESVNRLEEKVNEMAQS